MTIKGNAHVTINSVKYLLDTDVEDHYVHRLPGVFSHTDPYTSPDPKTRAHVKRLTWDITDWSGGEGNRVAYDDQQNKYDYGVGVDTRIPGQVGPRPKRDRRTVAVTSTDATTRTHYGRFADGGGKLYYFVDTKVYQAPGTYPAAWTSVSPTMESTNAFTAACGDNELIYASAWKDDGSGITAERTTMWSSDSGTTWQNLTSTETINGTDAGESGKNAFFDMVVHHGQLFAWTGRKLYSYDIANLNTVTPNSLSSDQYRKVYDTGSEPGGRVFGNTFWAGLVDCGTSLAFFASTTGRTMVYMYKQGVARPIFTKNGFTTKSIAYNSGILYVSGTFSAGSSTTIGHGAIYRIPLNSLSELPVKWVRQTVDSNLQMQIAGPGVGNQVYFCAAHTGRIFVYDLDYDGLSMLDDIGDDTTDKGTQELGCESGVDTGAPGVDPIVFTSNSHRISDIYQWGGQRFIGIYRPDTSSETVNQIVSWYNDEPAQRMTTSTAMNWHGTSPENDFGYPADLKALLGVTVSFWPESASTTSGLLANQQIRVQYALDKGNSITGAGTNWTTAGTITSSTTPRNSTRGSVFIDLSASTLKFTRARFRVLVDNNSTAGVNPPIALAVRPECEVLEYDETYDLVLKIKDMKNQAGGRISDRALKSNVMRDVLVTARKARNLVPFVDGFIYRENGRVAATQTVFIDELEDVVDDIAEGIMHVRLRVVPT